MKFRIIVRAPVLTMSGYGEQSRFALRALRKHEDKFDIYIIPVPWGNTNWISDDDEERKWLDSRIIKTATLLQTEQNPQFDISLQITIPNEFEDLAKINIGYTAGIETTRVAPVWLEKANMMDKIIVVSEHSKSVFMSSAYDAVNKETGEKILMKLQKPIEVVPYPVRHFEADPSFEMDLEYDFNYLLMAQWSLRKNIERTIKWFIEENIDQEVGLVIKTNSQANCKIDKEFTLDQRLRPLLDQHPDRKCKIYLLHGDMTTEELTALYNHPKIKCLTSLTHGEGYGLPLFEAAYNGLPIIAPGWSGQNDFLYASAPGPGGGKAKMRALFSEVVFDIQPVPKEGHWKGVIEPGSMWCFPQEGSFKMQLRKVRNKYDKALKNAKLLQEHLLENFEEEKIYDMFVKSVLGDAKMEATEYVFVSDVFHQQYVGGAELSLKTLIEASPGSATLVNSSVIDQEFVDFYKDSKWIFGNIASLDTEMIRYIIENKIEYSFIEFDYKFCKHRNPVLYNFLEGTDCEYSTTDRGSVIQDFISNSKSTFFMSTKQRDIYNDALPETSKANTHILSSLFDEQFFNRIQLLNDKYTNQPRDNKWIVLGSNSWVKGAVQSEDWCKENDVEHEVIFGMEYDQFLKRLSQAKGLCAMPAGYDTCPRLVIEAKLLGCALQTNEYVQHSDEEWFNRPNEEIIKYLKTRKDYFWMNAFNV
tara:strand:- start:1601 stop:3703 length:2103 start_codon:yes stop_codon:yes gene_type:complete